MSCGISLVKYVLFVFNLLCTICGVLLVVFGAILLHQMVGNDEVAEWVHTQRIPIAMIVLGLVIIIISFFGCCGAIKESYCMSMTYSVLLFVLMIAQLALVIWVWIQKEEYLRTMGKVVENVWAERNRKGDYMDSIQTNFHCCGKVSYRDYSFQGYYPQTCCDKSLPCNHETVYKIGCKTAFVDFWDKNSDIIKYGGLVIAAIEFVGVVFACCLANSVRNFKRRSAY